MAMSVNTEICNSMAMGPAEGNVSKHGNAIAWLWDLLKVMSVNTEICNSMVMGPAEGNVSKHRDLQ